METTHSEQLLGQKVLRGPAMPWDAPLHCTEEYAVRKAGSRSSLWSCLLSGCTFIPFAAASPPSLYLPGVAHVTGLHSAVAVIPRELSGMV